MTSIEAKGTKNPSIATSYDCEEGVEVAISDFGVL